MSAIKEFDMTLEEDLARTDAGIYLELKDMTAIEQQFVFRMAGLCAAAARLEEYAHMGVKQAEDRVPGMAVDLVGFEESELWGRICRRYPSYWPAIDTEMYRIYINNYFAK